MNMSTTVQPINQPQINLGFTTELFPPGTHMCYVYNDDAERRTVMAQYINAGIAAQEFVGYFADLDQPDLVQDYLMQMGIQVPDPVEDADAAPCRTLFATAHNIYCPSNHFSPETMLHQLQALYEECCAHQIAHLRVAGEMSWALSHQVIGADRLAEYESRLNLLVETHPLMAICQYDANRFDGATLFEVLKVHPMMVVRGQVVRNPYYIPAHEYLSGNLSGKRLPSEG